VTETLSIEFSGGTFTVPAVFPPTDSEDLYTVTAPFMMKGHWTVDVAGERGTVRFDDDIEARGRARFVLGADRRTGNFHRGADHL
jgi:hypothetical protein